MNNDIAPKIISLVPGRTDAELADDFKRRLVDAHEPLLALLDEMREAGFEANIMTAPGPLGKYVIAQLTLFKKY